MNEGASLLDTIRVEIQESIIAQHILTALDKWRQRSVNTFHFNYEHGLFEWVEHDRGGYSSSRFAQALTMLRDMGLFRSGGGEGQAELTDLGVLTLERTIRALNDS